MDFKETEKRIKERLEERKIQPSEGLWSELEEDLHPDLGFMHKNYVKYIVAALLVVGIFVASLFTFSSTESSDPIVDSETSQPERRLDVKNEPKSLKKEENLLPKIKKQVNVVQTENPSIENQEKKAYKKTNFKSPDLSSEVVIRDEVKHIEKKTESSEDKRDYEKIANQLLQEAEEAIAKTNAKDEAEVLLHEALQRESNGKRIDSSAVLVKVDQLLDEVTKEIDQEEDQHFREKVHDFIREKWEKARTGVAGRLTN